MFFHNIVTGGTVRQCILNSDEGNTYDITAARYRDTGDVVKVDSQGHLFYVGRKDRQIKRNGQRVNLDEIKMV